MDLFDEFFTIIGNFEKTGLEYTVVGGIAMAFHDQPRFTKDIGILVLPEDIGKATSVFKKLGYFESVAPWTFKKTNLTLHRFMKTHDEDFLVVDLLVGNEERHKEIVKHSLMEKSEKGVVRIANKHDLIWMKKYAIRIKVKSISRGWKMTKIERTVKDVSNLRDFYIKIKKIKKTDNKQEKIDVSSGRSNHVRYVMEDMGATIQCSS